MNYLRAWVRASGAAAVGLCIVSSLSHASDLKAWRLLVDSDPFPPGFAAPVGIYDPVRQRVLVIDVGLASQPTEVHVFEPGPEPRWSKLATIGTPPPQPYLASVVHDPVRDRLLIFGSRYGQALEVWALALSGTPTWQKLVTSGAPPVMRHGHTTVYDPVHDHVVLFGGVDEAYPAHYLSDVWAYSLSSDTWHAFNVAGPAPGGREGHGALYDPDGKRMLVFGGHFEGTHRGFWRDLWELTLEDSLAWSELPVTGPVPGARSAFGFVLDPVRRQLLVHGGINEQSGIEPDDLWAYSLEGVAAWTPIVTPDTLRGRSYPIDVYDPVADRLLACGGADYPQTAALSLAAPYRWSALLPPRPLLTPSARSGNEVLHDARRDRFVVVGGEYSSADSSMWRFDTGSLVPWQSIRAVTAPFVWSDFSYLQATVYDSLADRFTRYDSRQAWSSAAADPKTWAPLGPTAPMQGPGPCIGSGVAFDSKRNRLLVTGGLIVYPHSGDYTVGGVWALTFGTNPSWSYVGELPQEWGSAGHASYYDPVRDRLVLLGGCFRPGRLARYRYGAAVWSTPLDSTLQWTSFNSASGTGPPAPPDAQAAFDPRLNRLYIVADSSVWTRAVATTEPWTQLEFSTTPPSVKSAIAYDPTRDQLLALFASGPGTDHVQAWAVAVGPLSVSLLETNRSADAVALAWRSVTAFGRVAEVERREESVDWMGVGPIVFGPEGAATFVDHDVHAGHDYTYRVSVIGDSAVWHSEPVLVPDPASISFALFGARPAPAVGRVRLAFSLFSIAPARLEVYDLVGRRCFARDVGPLGPGIHSVSIEESTAWSPGIYFAQLRRGSESRTTRFVLVH